MTRPEELDLYQAMEEIIKNGLEREVPTTDIAADGRTFVCQRFQTPTSREEALSHFITILRLRLDSRIRRLEEASFFQRDRRTIRRLKRDLKILFRTIKFREERSRSSHDSH